MNLQNVIFNTSDRMWTHLFGISEFRQNFYDVVIFWGVDLTIEFSYELFQTPNDSQNCSKKENFEVSKKLTKCQGEHKNRIESYFQFSTGGYIAPRRGNQLNLDLRWIEIRDELGGTPQNFCTFDTPYRPCFIAFLRENFRKFSRFVVLILASFFDKFPKISKKRL